MWEEQDRLLSTVAQTLRPNWVEDHYNPMDRNGYLEECYFTYSYSPLFLDDGSIGGLFTAVTETTLRVIGERQMRCASPPLVRLRSPLSRTRWWSGLYDTALRTLRDLSTRGVEAKTVKDALRIAKESMTTTGKYVPKDPLSLLPPIGLRVANQPAFILISLSLSLRQIRHRVCQCLRTQRTRAASYAR
jgi:hypothetical protein